MDIRPDSDLDLRKEIAADAAEPEVAPSIFVRAGQFFLVPLAIVTSCVAVYLFFQYMVSEQTGPKDLISEIRTGGAVARKHAARISEIDRKSTRLNSSHVQPSRMPSSA